MLTLQTPDMAGFPKPYIYESGELDPEAFEQLLLKHIEEETVGMDDWDKENFEEEARENSQEHWKKK